MVTTVTLMPMYNACTAPSVLTAVYVTPVQAFNPPDGPYVYQQLEEVMRTYGA